MTDRAADESFDRVAGQTAASTGLLVRRALVDGNPRLAFRIWLNLADNLARCSGTPSLLTALVEEAPPSTGSKLYDNAIAGLVEERLAGTDASIPDWVANVPVLSVAERLADHDYMVAVQEADVPPALLLRGVVIDRVSLESI